MVRRDRGWLSEAGGQGARLGWAEGPSKVGWGSGREESDLVCLGSGDAYPVAPLTPLSITSSSPPEHDGIAHEAQHAFVTKGPFHPAAHRTLMKKPSINKRPAANISTDPDAGEQPPTGKQKKAAVPTEGVPTGILNTVGGYKLIKSIQRGKTLYLLKDPSKNQLTMLNTCRITDTE